MGYEVTQYTDNGYILGIVISATDVYFATNKNTCAQN